MMKEIISARNFFFKICRKRLTDFALVLKYNKRVFYASARRKLYGGRNAEIIKRRSNLW